MPPPSPSFYLISLGLVALAIGLSNFPRACRRKIYSEEDQKSLVFADKSADDFVKCIFFFAKR